MSRPRFAKWKGTHLSNDPCTSLRVVGPEPSVLIQERDLGVHTDNVGCSLLVGGRKGGHSAKNQWNLDVFREDFGNQPGTLSCPCGMPFTQCFRD